MVRKKKSDVLEVNQPSGGWPIINQGQHLIVKTYEDGSTELVWDDEALLEAVREAIASVEQEEATAKPKKAKGKKNGAA